MAKPLLPDAPWVEIAPEPPPEPPKPKGDWPRAPDRACLTGLLLVLRSGIHWGLLPRELGCGSGVTRWRRLRGWQEAGGGGRLHREPLDKPGGTGRIGWSRASADSASVPARRGARERAPRRQGLRHPALPPLAAPPRDQGSHRARAATPASASAATAGWSGGRWPGRIDTRRLTVRYGRRDDIQQASLALGCALIRCDYLHAE